MTIYDRNMKPGTQLVGRYHKQSYTCEVIEKEGKLIYRLADGREFKSPSAAGMAITGHACDGWVFWSVQTAEAAPATTEPVTERAPAAATIEPETTSVAIPPAVETAPAKKRIFRLPNQKGIPEGQTRWFCSGCMKGFLMPTGQEPAACPEGHPWEQVG